MWPQENDIDQVIRGASWESEITEKILQSFERLPETWKEKKPELIKVIATVNLVKSESAH